MKKKEKVNKPLFLIDFDSTFITHEGLDVFADIALTGNPKREEIVTKIQDITTRGMEGEIPFDKSLAQRISLLTAHTRHITPTVKKLKKSITPSIERNKAFFDEYKDHIYIISGGFKEFIVPVVTKFGIKKDHVFANTFTYDKDGNITGYDKNNHLAKEKGKLQLVQSLKLQGDLYVIGDGYTDYQIKEAGLAKKFIAFTENTIRDNVIQNADTIAPTFDEFLYINNLPRSLSYPKNRIKALLLENVDNDAVVLMEKEGYSVEYHEKSLSTQELVKRISDIHLLGIRSRTEVTDEVLKHAEKLLAIGAFCIGTDQISLKSATQQGVAVFNAPYSNTRSVVELVIGEIIMLIRGIPDKNKKLHQGVWDKSAAGSNEIRGKTLGIVGYGNIGSQLSVVAEALGMHVVFFDAVEKLALGNAKRCMSLKELLRQADIVTVHVDGRKANENLFTEKEFNLMKDHAIFLNLSRGKIVDIQALTKALVSKKIRGAAVDVFPTEPKGKDEPFVSPLQNLPNVILTPHIGGSTKEAQKNIAHFVSNKLIDYVNAGNTYNNVTLPDIQLPDTGKAHRLLHLHNNVPGILAHINSVLALHNMNILGQYLKTNDQIGYVITDVDRKYVPAVLKELKAIPDTIRFRVLY